MNDVERRVSKLEATFLRRAPVDDETPDGERALKVLVGIYDRYTARGRPVPEDIIRLLDRALRIMKAPADLREHLDAWLGITREQAAPGCRDA